MKVRYIGRVSETEHGRLKFGQGLDIEPAKVKELLDARALVVTEEDWSGADLTETEQKIGWRENTPEFRAKAAKLIAASATLHASLEVKE